MITSLLSTREIGRVRAHKKPTAVAKMVSIKPPVVLAFLTTLNFPLK